ncbi:hypothetical protein BJV78DRAFT_1253279 [Lactifluus subvellereus]|nr:hypothetical protein BJV78DRAFT_1253279 [Lactifluus subvellereus]
MHTDIPESTPASCTATQRRSWRRTVADALALARSAVELDARKTDPLGALAAYAKSMRHIRRIIVRLERYGAHAEARQLAAIVRPPFSLPRCAISVC